MNNQFYVDLLNEVGEMLMKATGGNETDGRMKLLMRLINDRDILTARVEALAAACLGMVEQCPVCGGEGDGTWMVQGRAFPCPYCSKARAALKDSQ